MWITIHYITEVIMFKTLKEAKAFLNKIITFEQSDENEVYYEYLDASKLSEEEDENKFQIENMKELIELLKTGDGKKIIIYYDNDVDEGCVSVILHRGGFINFECAAPVGFSSLLMQALYLVRNDLEPDDVGYSQD